MLLFLISIHKLEIFVVNEATTWSGVGRSFDFHFYPHLDAEIRTSLQVAPRATRNPTTSIPDSGFYFDSNTRSATASRSNHNRTKN